MKKIIIITIAFFSINYAATSQQWYHLKDTIALSYGLPGNIAGILTLHTINNSLIVTGAFDTVRNLKVNCVTSWDGNQWHKFDDGTFNGIPGDWILDVEYYNGRTYFGSYFGVFSNPNFYWTGSSWGNPVAAPNSVIDALGSYNGKLYVGGGFGYLETYSNPTFMYSPYFAVFDGTNWTSSYPNKGPNNRIFALETFNSEVFAAGMFDDFANINAHYVARYDGASWKPVGGGADCYGTAMAVDTFNNVLYIGGCFDHVFDEQFNPIPVDGIGLWDGFGWHSVGYNDTVQWEINKHAMAVYRGDLYAGIETSSNASSIYHCIARWDGIKWDSLGHGLDGAGMALSVFQDTLWVGGNFAIVNGDSVAQGLAKWFMPDTSCNYLKPTIHTLADTFYLNTGQPTVDVQFYNNNAYVNSWAWDFGDLGTAATQNPTHTYSTAGTFNVSVTVTHNTCVKTANKTIVVVDNTGIAEYTKESLQFKLYPNPTTGDVTVVCTLPNAKTGLLKTHQLNGTTKDEYHLQSGFNKIIIPASGLSNGVSLVSVFVDGKYIFAEKVVKK